ncbi:hypothetical protein ACFWMP_31415 [Paenibacillus sp. NPDC058367]|uniref:hypothetical protein n=1 Tax=Paenibacillus sp. NPDC058367 TaxID=3346460 RepID=UPI003662CEF8
MPKKVTEENELEKVSIRVPKINLKRLDDMPGTRTQKINDAILGYIDRDKKTEKKNVDNYK